MTDISTCLNRALKVVSFSSSPLAPIPLIKVGETTRREHTPHSRSVSTVAWLFASYSQNQALRRQRRDKNQDQGSSVRVPAFGSTLKRHLGLATVTHLWPEFFLRGLHYSVHVTNGSVRCSVGECRLSQLRASDQHLFDLLPRIVALCEMPSAEPLG